MTYQVSQTRESLRRLEQDFGAVLRSANGIGAGLEDGIDHLDFEEMDHLIKEYQHVAEQLMKIRQQIKEELTAAMMMY